ncbi:Storage protein LPV, partial [Phytophthora megakarya]
MKSPTNYGSENEETRFIRRVAAPDRPNNKRRQKKRLAIAGATLGLLAASAGVGYTAMKNAGSTSAVKTTKLEASMSNEARQFISKLGDAFHPDFDKIDKDHDGQLSKSEILDDLKEKEMVDVDKVQASDLPENIKKNVVALLEAKLKSDGDCAKLALDERKVAVAEADHDIFYYMLDVFCPRVTIAVTPPDQEEEGEQGYGGANQQTVVIPTPDGGTTQAIIVGEPEDGKQTIAIQGNDGEYTQTEVRSIETPTGEQKILIPNAEGDITPVVVPEIPQEVIEQAQQTGEQVQAVSVVTDDGETQQIIIQGEPDEHNKVTVQIPDNEGGYTETEAKVTETATGEEQITVRTTDGDIIQVPVPEIVEENYNHPYSEELPEPVQQVVSVTTTEGEQVQVTLIGEVEHGEQTVQITDESGKTTVEEVKAIETPSGDEKLILPEVDTPVIVQEVPQEVIEQAQQTGEQVQAVSVVTDEVVTDDGETQQIIIQGEPDEHNKVTVQIPDNEGGYTETEAKVTETATGEE